MNYSQQINPHENMGFSQKVRPIDERSITARSGLLLLIFLHIWFDFVSNLKIKEASTVKLE